MNLKIAVCDDVLSHRQQLISLIKAEDSCYQCFEYKNGEMLLWDFESGIHFDIFFLDIFMESISGIETAKRIRMVNPNALLIFVSSSNDFYRESYDLYAFNYLIKPVTPSKINEVLSRAAQHLGKDMEQVVQFSFNNVFHTVRYSQILYLSSDKRIVNFHLTDGKKLKSYGKLDDFATQLPDELFLRCHQSYIVNLKHVTSMTTSEFAFGDIKIPISRKHSSSSLKKYHSMLFSNF